MKQETLIKAMLVLFISLMAFSVGTFVGKEVADSDHKREQLIKELYPNDGAKPEGTVYGP